MLRVWRTKSHAGVAAAMWLLLVVAFGAWIGLAVRSSDGVLLAANLTNPALAALVLVGMVRADGWPARKKIGSLAILIQRRAKGLAGTADAVEIMTDLVSKYS
jgi:hypothetical protein